MTDPKPRLFTDEDVERAMSAHWFNAEPISGEKAMLKAPEAGLSPEARRVLEAAKKLDATIAEFGYHIRTQEARDELALAAIDFARSLQPSPERNSDGGH